VFVIVRLLDIILNCEVSRILKGFHENKEQEEAGQYPIAKIIHKIDEVFRIRSLEEGKQSGNFYRLFPTLWIDEEKSKTLGAAP